MTCVERHVLESYRPPQTAVTPTLSIVVPTWNGGMRLAETLEHLRDYQAQLDDATEILIVDDCSEAGTARIARDFADHNELVCVIRNDRNRGKGYAVARGMQHARGHYRVFVDSDLAYPGSEISKLILALKSGNDVAVACRVLPESRYIMSPTFFRYLYTRHVMSRAFNRVVQRLLLPGILDTQAGLKAFTARAAKQIFSRQTLSGFGFDIECLLIARLQGFRITEVPVDFYYSSEASTISFVRHGTEMLRDLIRVRQNARRGLYG
jgi:dolichyl-phosphate beta-glucosyltransferase